MQMPFLPGPDAALFLDFDGTLVGIAETPEAVKVPEGLVPLLAQLNDALQGAVAIVSGRPVDVLDRFLAPLRLPTAGEHGAHRRDATGHLLERAPTDLSEVIAAANELANRHTGLLVERKQAAVALHYRLAPQLEQLCLDTMAETVGDRPEFELLHGKCVVEIKPAGTNKGTAITAYLKEAPFTGRKPFFFGDDTTDESGFAVAQAFGGLGIKVGPGSTRATARVDGPPAVYDWLQRAAAALAVPGAAAR